MLDKIWLFMMVAGLTAGIAGGNTDKLVKELMASSRNAVELCISLAGVMCFWSGLMRVIEKGGISTIIANILHPVLKILFPQIQRSKKALGAIAMSMSANFLGLGNAATPLGINAMKELSLINRSHSIIDASDEMCMFVVLNTSGLQLIPATIIALRSASGSQDPGGIMLPIWICSIFSVFVGIIAVKIFKGIHKKKSMKNRY